MDRELAELHRGAYEEQRRLIPDADVEPRFDRGPVQVDLEGEATRAAVPRLKCAGRTAARHPTVTMALAKADPLEYLCPRCEARYQVERVETNENGRTSIGRRSKTPARWFRFAQRISDDAELLYVVGQIERVLELGEGRRDLKKRASVGIAVCGVNVNSHIQHMKCNTVHVD